MIDEHSLRNLKEQRDAAAQRHQESYALWRVLDEAYDNAWIARLGVIPGRSIAMSYDGRKFVVDRCYCRTPGSAVRGTGYLIRKDGTKGKRWDDFGSFTLTGELLVPPEAKANKSGSDMLAKLDLAEKAKGGA
jgi:hypothetical protein